MRIQPQAAAGPFVPANKQSPLAPLAKKPQYKPRDQKRGGKRKQKRQKAPPSPIALLENVLAVWMQDTVLLGRAGCFWGAGALAVSPLQGPTENCGVLLREGCPWDWGAGDSRGGLSPKNGSPHPGFGRNSLCSSPKSDATPNPAEGLQHLPCACRVTGCDAAGPGVGRISPSHLPPMWGDPKPCAHHPAPPKNSSKPNTSQV